MEIFKEYTMINEIYMGIYFDFIAKIQEFTFK